MIHESVPVPQLKTPIKHYGGQSRIISDILPLLPPHHLYNEPFVRDAALLFAKEPAPINVINDRNGELVNFYRTVVSDFDALLAEIGKTLHSREQTEVAKFIYSHPAYFSNVQRAWAVWAMSKLCFMNALDSTFSYSRTGKNQVASRVMNEKAYFRLDLKELLEKCTIEQDDPIHIVRRYDSSKAFHYLVPPLENSDDAQQLNELLEVLTTLRGKFMLVVDAHPRVRQYAGTHDWMIHRLDRPAETHVSTANNTKREKQEQWLVVNYRLPEYWNTGF